MLLAALLVLACLTVLAPVFTAVLLRRRAQLPRVRPGWWVEFEQEFRVYAARQDSGRAPALTAGIRDHPPPQPLPRDAPGDHLRRSEKIAHSRGEFATLGVANSPRAPRPDHAARGARRRSAYPATSARSDSLTELMVCSVAVGSYPQCAMQFSHRGSRPRP